MRNRRCRSAGSQSVRMSPGWTTGASVSSWSTNPRRRDFMDGTYGNSRPRLALRSRSSSSAGPISVMPTALRPGLKYSRLLRRSSWRSRFAHAPIRPAIGSSWSLALMSFSISLLSCLALNVRRSRFSSLRRPFRVEPSVDYCSVMSVLALVVPDAAGAGIDSAVDRQHLPRDPGRLVGGQV